MSDGKTEQELLVEKARMVQEINQTLSGHSGKMILLTVGATIGSVIMAIKKQHPEESVESLLAFVMEEAHLCLVDNLSGKSKNQTIDQILDGAKPQ